MGWSLGFDTSWNRDIGYGVPAWCDYPGCYEEINRGLAYVCGGEPYGGDDGCGLYFCGRHHSGITDDGDSLCERCERGQKPFKPSPDHEEWTEFKMTDESWAAWREDSQP